MNSTYVRGGAWVVAAACVLGLVVGVAGFDAGGGGGGAAGGGLGWGGRGGAWGWWWGGRVLRGGGGGGGGGGAGVGGGGGGWRLGAGPPRPPLSIRTVMPSNNAPFAPCEYPNRSCPPMRR